MVGLVSVEHRAVGNVSKTMENVSALGTGERGFGCKDSFFHRTIPGFMATFRYTFDDMLA